MVDYQIPSESKELLNYTCETRLDCYDKGFKDAVQLIEAVQAIWKVIRAGYIASKQAQGYKSAVWTWDFFQND